MSLQKIRKRETKKGGIVISLTGSTFKEISDVQTVQLTKIESRY